MRPVNKPDASGVTGRSRKTPAAEMTAATVVPLLLSPPGRQARFQVRRLVSLVVCAAGLAALFAMDTVCSAATQATKSEPGISYTNERVASVPWSIHVLKIDRSRADLTFFAAHAKGQVLGVSRIVEQARAVPTEIGRAIAGVNGDFYERDNPTYAGDPRGLQIINGDLVSAPSTVCAWLDAAGHPHLDEVKGDFQVTWPNGQKTSIGLNQQWP